MEPIVQAKGWIYFPGIATVEIKIFKFELWCYLAKHYRIFNLLQW